MGRGPARPVKFSEDGPRPGQANFQMMGRGPVQPITSSKIPGPARPIIFSNVSAQSGPAHHLAARPMKHGLYMGRPDNDVGQPAWI